MTEHLDIGPDHVLVFRVGAGSVPASVLDRLERHIHEALGCRCLVLAGDEALTHVIRAKRPPDAGDGERLPDALREVLVLEALCSGSSAEYDADTGEYRLEAYGQKSQVIRRNIQLDVTDEERARCAIEWSASE